MNGGDSRLKGIRSATWRAHRGFESHRERDCSSVGELSDKVVDALNSESWRGQLIKLSEVEVRATYPDLVVASVGAIRKDMPGDVVTAWVLFDGTHGISVNTRTRIRDQEKAPVASDLKLIVKYQEVK